MLYFRVFTMLYVCGYRLYMNTKALNKLNQAFVSKNSFRLALISPVFMV